ncbi:unnamed protein product (macronuclear) [Paramecium tetraurelia]|uniref:Protein kinase domain-containing protein n=1 Tax=Paramecium tetraurelia TaxID=5888 RepID=A0CHT4_PARTE|nr:uncharacterized protein GSPATT00038453001 [Paramecium tetraurelia]CAK70351.1 unnamed protein product [Paramecium tetraurelia]|eukprot:XP_001437748.1 hypothetical protein (macronuclear) [Paramecium tetraurelia strain d4-2]
MDNQEEVILKCYKDSEERTFKLIKYIGAGSEGFVSLYKPINWCFEVDEVAIKSQSTNIKSSAIDFYKKLMEQQLKIEKSSDEKSHIIKIYELCQNTNEKGELSEFLVIMEKGGDDLYKYQKHNKQLTFQQKVQICLQLAQGLKQLHQLDYIHRDIKPENFVLAKDGFKLIDFGLTKSINQEYMSMNVGSRLFQAPEVLVGDGNYTSSIDIWSLGCTFYEVFSDDILIKAQNYMDAFLIIRNHTENQKYLYGKIEALQIQQEWKDLIKDMLHPEPNKRITSENLVLKIQSLLNKQNNQFQPTVQNMDRFCTPQNGMVNPQTNNCIPQKKVFQTINAQTTTQNEIPQFNRIQTPNQNIINNLNGNQFHIQPNFISPSGSNVPKVLQTCNPQITTPTNNNNYIQKFDQNAFANNKQNEMYEILNQRIQKLESELQNVKQEMVDLKKEVTVLKDEKGQLLDQNTKMKAQLNKYVKQQQTSLIEFQPFLIQTQQP